MLIFSSFAFALVVSVVVFFVKRGVRRASPESFFPLDESKRSMNEMPALPFASVSPLTAKTEAKQTAALKRIAERKKTSTGKPVASPVPYTNSGLASVVGAARLVEPPGVAGGDPVTAYAGAKTDMHVGEDVGSEVGMDGGTEFGNSPDAFGTWDWTGAGGFSTDPPSSGSERFSGYRLGNMRQPGGDWGCKRCGNGA